MTPDQSAKYGDAEDYGDVPSAAELREAVERVRRERERHEREDAAEPSLEEFFVWWDRITLDEVAAFRKCLEGAADEGPLQRFLEANPVLLVQPLGGGHGRWVIPHQRLGSEHVTDFMVAEKSSIGFEWVAVEIESPRAHMFNRKGDPSATLNHAIRQIADWRTWLGRNRDYALRPRDQSGLGLIDVDGKVPGWIVLGRRGESLGDVRERRRELSQQLNIKIHTYDWLLERAEDRARWAESQRASRVKPDAT